MFDYFFFISSTDTVIEDQVWKEKVDLQIFQKLMEQCNISNSDYNKMRYIKFISEEESCDENVSTKDHVLIDNESVETEKVSTGGITELSTSSADQMFLETTV